MNAPRRAVVLATATWFLHAASTHAAPTGDVGTPPGPGSPTPALALPQVAGDLTAFVEGQLLPSIASVPGAGASASPGAQRNHYVLPTAAQLDTFRLVFRALAAGDPVGAHLLAQTASETYHVVEFHDLPTGSFHHVLMEGVPGQIPAPIDRALAVSLVDPTAPGRRGWGTYVWNPAPTHKVSFGAPHPKDDLETGDEAVEAYLATGARYLMIAGTDRDQNPALATCAQSSRPYLEADAAHNVETVFQIAFEELHAADPGVTHVQLHGNATCTADVFLSSGDTPPAPELAALAHNLGMATRAWAGNGVKLSVEVYDAPTDCSLRGTTNVQLRFAAGTPHDDLCLPGASTHASRFVHLESSRVARRAPTDPLATLGRNRAVVLAALRRTF